MTVLGTKNKLRSCKRSFLFLGAKKAMLRVVAGFRARTASWRAAQNGAIPACRGKA